MGQRKENAEPVPLTPEWLWKFFEKGLLRPNLFTPVPVYSSQEQRHRLSVPSEPFWRVCTAWLRYHTIQILWDIERTLARLFHRRWGS